MREKKTIRRLQNKSDGEIWLETSDCSRMFIAYFHSHEFVSREHNIIVERISIGMRLAFVNEQMPLLLEPEWVRDVIYCDNY